MVIVKIYSFSFANRQIFDIILYLLLIRHAEACHLLSQEKADIVQVLERWQIPHLPAKQEFTVVSCRKPSLDSHRRRGELRSPAGVQRTPLPTKHPNFANGQTFIHTAKQEFTFFHKK